MNPMKGKANNSNSQFSSKIVEKLYLNENQADIHFNFNSGESFPAHKFLLSTASPQMKELFNSKWNDLKEINIAGISASAFKEFLQFFYLKTVRLSMENIEHVMNYCSRLKIDEGIAVCGHFLKDNINDENIFWVYNLAITFDDIELKEFCEKVIGFNGNEYLASDGFKKCSREVLSHILDMNETLRCSEVELFEACMNWVRAKSKQDELTKDTVKAELGDLLYKIRFGSMSFRDIGKLMFSYATLFTTDEYKEILRRVLPDTYEPTFCESRQKHNVADSKLKGDNSFCYHYLKTNYGSHVKNRHLRNIETTIFSSNKWLLLTAFGFLPPGSDCFGSLEYYEGIPTEITVIEINPNKSNEKVILQKQKATIGYERVVLSKQIFIKPKFIYKIVAEQKPLENYVLTKRFESTLKLDSNIELTFTNENEDADEKYVGGIIECISFINTEKNNFECPFHYGKSQ